MVLRIFLWAFASVDHCAVRAGHQSVRLHHLKIQQRPDAAQPSFSRMRAINHTLHSAHPSANAISMAGGGKGENFAALQRAEVTSEKTAIDFGSPDKDHMHGLLGIDEGKPIWNPTPLFKPLEEWSAEESRKAHQEYSFNKVVSDSLPLDREHYDSRNASCKPKTYHVSTMKPASIIVVFFNEAFSPLVRSLHSILNTAPPRLVGEIVLVDDGSEQARRPWLGTQLENYVKRGLPKIRLSRLTARSGLMQARMHGARIAKFENLIFLDSHIECSPGWIEPLLARLTEDYKNVALPVIKSINAHSFTRHSKGFIDTMAHSWTLGQAFLPQRRLSTTEPNDSPAMAGGLFAITKRWFDELGQYDSEMQEYGGEEMELSFKIWQCGGTLQSIPCSQISHVFRTSEYWQGRVFPVGPHVIQRNRLRAAVVWMDDAAQLVKLAISDPVAEQNIGDVSVPRKVRERLRCRDFNWYHANVYPELFVPNMKGALSGSIRHTLPTHETLCFDTLHKKKKGDAIGLFPCHEKIRSGSQAFLLTSDGKLRVDDMDFITCLAIRTPAVRGGGTVQLSECSDSDPQWTFQRAKDGHRGTLKQGDMCLGATKKSTGERPFSFTVNRCAEGSGEDLRVLWDWI